MPSLYYSPASTSRQRIRSNIVGRLSVLVFLLLLAPLAIVNCLISLIEGRSPWRRSVAAQGLSFPEFQSGWLRDQWALLLIVRGHLTWFDGSTVNAGDTLIQSEGLVNERKLHALSGLAQDASNDCLGMGARGASYLDKTLLLLRYGLAKLFYTDSQGKHSKQISLFGIEINNLTMTQAVDALLSPVLFNGNGNGNGNDRTRTACFVNVNSFNLARKNPALHRAINQADIVLADGSGVRLAAQRKGTALAENVNGTDLLPHLCCQAVQKSLCVFLLGGQNGVADEAATKLRALFPGLKIVGTQHGYFSPSESQGVVEQINATNADIVLVALGSPNQEAWLEANKHCLNARVGIAVGGLFDFFSGRIPRAPLWLRELGMEWVWRLMQEPKAKFKRYVLGNPAFLYRILRHKNDI